MRRSRSRARRGRSHHVSQSSYLYPGWALLTEPSPLGVSGRTVRVSLSVRGSAGPGFGPGQFGHVPARPTGVVVRASFGRRDGSRQSELRAGLRVSRYWSRVAVRGQCPHHVDWSRCELGARFWEMGHGPVAQPAAAVVRGQSRAPSCPVCGPALIFGFLFPAAPFFIVLPLYTSSC